MVAVKRPDRQASLDLYTQQVQEEVDELSAPLEAHLDAIYDGTDDDLRKKQIELIAAFAGRVRQETDASNLDVYFNNGAPSTSAAVAGLGSGSSNQLGTANQDSKLREITDAYRDNPDDIYELVKNYLDLPDVATQHLVLRAMKGITKGDLTANHRNNTITPRNRAQVIATTPNQPSNNPPVTPAANSAPAPATPAVPVASNPAPAHTTPTQVNNPPTQVMPPVNPPQGNSGGVLRRTRP